MKIKVFNSEVEMNLDSAVPERFGTTKSNNNYNPNGTNFTDINPEVMLQNVISGSTASQNPDFGEQLKNALYNQFGEEINAVKPIFTPSFWTREYQENQWKKFWGGDNSPPSSALDILKNSSYRSFSVNDWRNKRLNPLNNVANTASTNFPGELGKATGGIANKWSGNPWSAASGQLLDQFLGGANTFNSWKDAIGAFSSNTEPTLEELVNLNTVTAETMYTSKPGISIKPSDRIINDKNPSREEKKVTNFNPDTNVVPSKKITNEKEVTNFTTNPNVVPSRINPSTSKEEVVTNFEPETNKFPSRTVFSKTDPTKEIDFTTLNEEKYKEKVLIDAPSRTEEVITDFSTDSNKVPLDKVNNETEVTNFSTDPNDVLKAPSRTIIDPKTKKEIKFDFETLNKEKYKEEILIDTPSRTEKEVTDFSTDPSTVPSKKIANETEVTNFDTINKDYEGKILIEAPSRKETEFKEVSGKITGLLKSLNEKKDIGHIHVSPFIPIKGGIQAFDIDFEFNPEISESPLQANYQTETLLGRLGQFQIFTGTNLSTLNVELQYIALAPDDSTNADNYTLEWQKTWTPKKLKEIEYKLRSLVLADYVDGDGFLIKPPLVEIILDKNKKDDDDLYAYPADSGNNYLKYSKALKGEGWNWNKKYVVSSVQISNLNSTSIYYSTRASFKASLQLVEVTENFLDLVPDFKAYYDAFKVLEPSPPSEGNNNEL